MAAKRPKEEAGESSGGGGGGRRWENLPRDVLVTIFAKLGVDDLISAVPFLCSTWHDAALDPSCWRALDFRDWGTISRRLGCRQNDDFYVLLKFSMDRSQDSLRSIHFTDFADDFYLIEVADRCLDLRYFSLPNGKVTEDNWFHNAISKLGLLEGMAVGESMICHEVLAHVKECCPNFSELKIFAEVVEYEMANAICDCLPNLRKLEMMNCSMPCKVLENLLDKLKELEYLDIYGKLEDELEGKGITAVVQDKASRLKVFLWDSNIGEDSESEDGFGYCEICGVTH